MVMPMNFYGMNAGMGMGAMGMGAGMGMQNSSGNVYDNVKAKYGCGYSDYGHRPKIGDYPVDTIPQPDLRPSEKTWLGRIIRKLYN